MKNIRRIGATVVVLNLFACFGLIQSEADEPVAHIDEQKVALFQFEGDTINSLSAANSLFQGGGSKFVGGLDGQALRVGDDEQDKALSYRGLNFRKSEDFSVLFWVRTVANSDDRFVILSNKDYLHNSLECQKQRGFAFYSSYGTWAWSMGSGSRRIVYERDNGSRMPINDGRWHQLAMTFDSERATVRLYYDGVNKVTYNIRDSSGFDCAGDGRLRIGTSPAAKTTKGQTLSSIANGAREIQELVDQFNQMSAKKVNDADLMKVVISPKRLFADYLQLLKNESGNQESTPIKRMEAADIGTIERLAKKLMKNPFTVYQVADFMLVAPLLKIYRLENGKVVIDQKVALEYASREDVTESEFDMDSLAIWKRTLSATEVKASYAKYFSAKPTLPNKSLSKLTAASWNIHHGGIHETISEDGWDSRKTIAQIIKREEIDIVMMQETYSSGDYIAAELGYCLATTVDWDYLNQGSNISVLSRFPITEIDVPETSSFMNVAAKISLSQTQEIFAMSNWYGMNQFSAVAEHHKLKFGNANRIPVLFAGDFNAVPHTDGGRSPASQHLLKDGFVDAYREQFPNVKENPGASHRSGSRIDQLYYKGVGLKHLSTKVLSEWPSKFPSDHYLIKSIFELKNSTQTAPAKRKGEQE